MLRILLVEDDSLHANWLTSRFNEEFQDIEIKRIESESQFHKEFENVETFAPDLIILDVMVRWKEPSADPADLPDDVRTEGFYRAGFRCLKLLGGSEKLNTTPVIIHSILEKDDLKEELVGLPNHIVISSKTSLLEEELFMFVRSMLKELPEDNLRKKTILSRLLESSELKPGWFGIKIDLKSVFGKKKHS